MSIYHECKSSQNLKSLIQNNNVVVVKLGATWCGPCKAIKADFDSLAVRTIENLKQLGENRPSIVFLSIDIDDMCQDNGMKWGDHLNCSGVPMFLIFSRGKTKNSFMGGDLNPVMDCIDECLHQFLNTTPVQSV